ANALKILNLREEIEYGDPVFSVREDGYVTPIRGTTYYLSLREDFREMLEATIIQQNVEGADD
ncbi:MAG: hypothetical protein ACE5IO_06470, partial [Thermoplasmata archaeon]